MKKFNEITLRLISGETIDFIDIQPNFNEIKEEIRVIKNNASLVYRQLKKVKTK